MTMRRAKEALGEFGDLDLAKQQAKILAEFQRRHPGMEDVSLTGKLSQLQTARSEVVLPPLSPETQRIVERMRHGGYAIYETTGKTPVAVKSEGMKFWYLNPRLEDLTAVPALLAFRKAPSEFFLPGGHNIPHDEQVKLIPGEQAKVDAKYPGAGLVVREGKLSEWIELAWEHFRATDVRIFGRDYGYKSTWTDTYESKQPGARRASVGRWLEADGADAFLWGPGRVFPLLGLALLVEIPRK